MEHTAAKKKMSTAQMTAAALVTAVTCILGPMSVPIPVSPVPISLTNLVLYFSVYLLGARRAAVSYLVYLLIGMTGLPVFSGFSGGLGKLAGPTGGYLLGFLFLVVISGMFVERFPGNAVLQGIGMVLGTAVCYLFGTVWLSGQMHIGFGAGLAVGVLPYLPADAVKIILALAAGPKISRRVALGTRI